jgi:hypothetical protein
LAAASALASASAAVVGVGVSVGAALAKKAMPTIHIANDDVDAGIVLRMLGTGFSAFVCFS